MKSFNYWLWLQSALGPGAGNTGCIFDFYQTAEEVFRESDRERRTSGVFSPVQIEHMAKCDIECTYDIVRDCGEAGVDIVTPDDGDYPELLREIFDFPLVLYVRGDLSCLKRNIPIAIVGTRAASPRAMTAASELAKAVSLCGFTVVSGGALGIDSAAHTGALVSGNETVAVLGCGHLDKYLKENEPLRGVIAKNGATVSEYPPRTASEKYFFPVRNRIISGMSAGTVVIEAKYKSGSLITATLAREQGREVFALPQSGFGRRSEGCEHLLSGGANRLVCPLDLIGQYLQLYPEKITINPEADLSLDLTGSGLSFAGFQKDSSGIVSLYERMEEEKRLKGKPEKRELTDPLSENAVRVYAAFDRDPVSIKELGEKVIMPAGSLLGALTELELYGYIALLPNSEYTVK